MSAGRAINTISQSWGTPHKYVNAVKEVFGGHIDLDPCSNEFSIVNATREYRLPQHDGLQESWNYPTIYVNPPYGIDKERGTTIKDWLAMCSLAHEEYHSEVQALVPIAANTMHWKKYVFTKARAICFLYDTRLRFLENGIDAGKGAPMACAMIYWGNNQSKFYEVFIGHGAVVDISNLIGEKIGMDRKKRELFLWKKEKPSALEAI
ncbi:MAG: phage N-6-adenine-methyltransferase [Deltaproteobacteria bacterium]|jgi:hypothetical protein|nr:phage N-6-adenine-methyltransferase [Deltaproteobacteria bacterium]